jgi:hypothetical protein
MAFTEVQEKALKAKLSGKVVRTRDQDGMSLSYVEGWHVIAEANRIFGFDAWDRRTVHAECVWQGTAEGLKGCSYVARVQVRVRAKGAVVVREGCGSGHGLGLNLGEAHERAIKEAETDAMKRALVTFGNPFGLALYDREKRGVRVFGRRNDNGGTGAAVRWAVFSAAGERLSEYMEPIEYCAEVRRQLEQFGVAETATAFWKRNQGTVAELRKALPQLKTEKGQHYAEILGSLFTKRLQQFAQKLESVTDSGPMQEADVPVNGAEFPITHPRRIRDKDHLRYVAEQPCLVCGRSPSQAHHLRHTQPRTLGRKVSDEWVVPLCASHHRSLHDVGNEMEWWQANDINASKEAERLWEIHRRVGPTA